jgi:hypothetical protein
MRKESIRNVRGRRAGATLRALIASQAVNKAAEGEITGVLGMRKVDFAAADRL